MVHVELPVSFVFCENLNEESKDRLNMEILVGFFFWACLIFFKINFVCIFVYKHAVVYDVWVDVTVLVFV